MQYSDLTYLAVPLPEDVLKAKGYGDFHLANAIIDRRLASDRTPDAIKKRLELEKMILEQLPREYPYSEEEALKALREAVGDVSVEEFHDLRLDNRIDWIYVNGEVRYKDDFLSNLLKVSAEYAEKARARGKLPPMPAGPNLLDETIRELKEKGALRTHMKMRTTLTIQRDETHQNAPIDVWLPIPAEQAQIRNVRILTEGGEISRPDSAQHTILFRGDRDRSVFSVEYEFDTELTYMQPDAARVTKAQPTFYTEELLPHIRFTPFLKDLARQIVGSETNPLLKARRIYDYITQNITYSYMRAYQTMPMIPEFLAAGGKGDCGVQALLFITLCRIEGIPATWQSGVYAEPRDEGIHDWARFYVAPYGWLFCDCSFGGGALRKGNRERWDFYFCNLDPFRMPANNEFQHDFETPPRFMRYDPYDNQMGEAEYPEMAVPKACRRIRHEVLSVSGVDAVIRLMTQQEAN